MLLVLACATVFLVWVLAPLPLAMGIGRAFAAGSTDAAGMPAPHPAARPGSGSA